MKVAKNIVNLFLILAMLSTALPLFDPEDINRDKRMDLDDVVLSVLNFSRSAENPATFIENMERVVSTLNIVAGLKTIIKPQENTNHTKMPSTLDAPYMISSYDQFLPVYSGLQFIENSLIYKSLTIPPTSPPPQNNFDC